VVEHYDVVDLGTKHGNAITTFLSVAKNKAKQKVIPQLAAVNFNVKELKPSNCVGIERPQAESYRDIVEKKGYKFSTLDLSSKTSLDKLPKGKAYLLWHFLEHLPNKQTSQVVLQKALDQATGLVWCRLPSFQQDNETGEGVLRQLGLRFTWTHWTGHTCPWLVEDCVDTIKNWQKANKDRSSVIVVKPCEYMIDTNDNRIVPISAPIDVQKYDKSMGKKPFKKFDNKVVSAWEVVTIFLS